MKASVRDAGHIPKLQIKSSAQSRVHHANVTQTSVGLGSIVSCQLSFVNHALRQCYRIFQEKVAPMTQSQAPCAACPNVRLTRYSPDINLGSGFAGKNQLKAPTLLIDNDPGMRNVSRQRILCPRRHGVIKFSFTSVVKPK